MFPQFRLKVLILQKISECTTFKAPFFQDSIPQAPAFTHKNVREYCGVYTACTVV